MILGKMKRLHRDLIRKNVYKKIVAVLAVLVFLGFIIMLVTIINSSKKNSNKQIEGIWTVDDVTYYEFCDSNVGYLITSINKYQFRYETKENKILLDFDDKNVKDTEYSYEISGNLLFFEKNNQLISLHRK